MNIESLQMGLAIVGLVIAISGFIQNLFFSEGKLRKAIITSSAFATLCVISSLTVFFWCQYEIAVKRAEDSILKVLARERDFLLRIRFMRISIRLPIFPC